MTSSKLTIRVPEDLRILGSSTWMTIPPVVLWVFHAFGRSVHDFLGDERRWMGPKLAIDILNGDQFDVRPENVAVRFVE